MSKIKICLDAGHYGKYNQSPVNKKYYESDMAWKLHLLLKKYLEQYGIEVIQTRSNQATDLSLKSRGKASKGCDLFISLHSNACNTESVDYPLVIVPISGKGNKIGEVLADCVADVMGTKQGGRTMDRKGSGNWDYYGVIYGATSVGTVGLIIEHSFHTNTRATNWLLSDSNLDKLAQAEAKTIADFYGLKKPATNVNNSTLYRVQVGAYSNQTNAKAFMAKVKAAGFDAYLVKVDGLYKIQVGAFGVKANANNMLAKLKAKGFTGFITTKSSN